MRGKEIRNLDKVRNGKHIFFFTSIYLGKNLENLERFYVLSKIGQGPVAKLKTEHRERAEHCVPPTGFEPLTLGSQRASWECYQLRYPVRLSLEDGYKLDNKDNRTIKQLPQKVCRTKTAFKNVYF